jgi:hypothetical protein
MTVALPEAELLGDDGVGPERAAGAVGGGVQEEQERDLLEAQLAEALTQPVIDPGEVGGQRADAGGIDELDGPDRVAHDGSSRREKSPVALGRGEWNA